MDFGLFLFVILIMFGPGVFVAYHARRMGYDTELWFIYGLVSWPIALIHLAIISDASAKNTSLRRSCPHCAEMILRHALVCTFCRRDLESGWSFTTIPEVEKTIKFPQGPGTEGVVVYVFNGKEYPARDIAENARDLYIANQRA